MTTDKDSKRELSGLLPLAVRVPSTAGTVDPSLRDRLEELFMKGRSDRTWRTYASAWRSYERFCAAREWSALPSAPEMVVAYLGTRSIELRASSLEVHVAAINKAHALARVPSPTKHISVVELMRGIRVEDDKPTRKAKGLDPDSLRELLSAIPDDLRGRRDRAVLLSGWWGALRRSEIVALDREDLEFAVRGVAVRIRRSKTDQENRGATLALPRTGGPLCPERALQVWVNETGIRGALFRGIDRNGKLRDARLTAQSVALILRRACERVGINAAVVSPHSLRRGMITAAAERAIEERVIARHSRHRSTRVLREYIEDGELWNRSAAVRLAAGLAGEGEDQS